MCKQDAHNTAQRSTITHHKAAQHTTADHSNTPHNKKQHRTHDTAQHHEAQQSTIHVYRGAEPIFQPNRATQAARGPLGSTQSTACTALDEPTISYHLHTSQID